MCIRDRFGNGENHLVTGWHQKTVTLGSENRYQTAEEVMADSLILRQNPTEYVKKNAPIVLHWDSLVVFGVDSEVQSLVHNDFLQPIYSERFMIQAFVQWTEDETTPKPRPYRFDLQEFPGPGRIYPWLSSSLKNRYRDLSLIHI